MPRGHENNDWDWLDKEYGTPGGDPDEDDDDDDDDDSNDKSSETNKPESRDLKKVGREWLERRRGKEKSPFKADKYDQDWPLIPGRSRNKFRGEQMHRNQDEIRSYLDAEARAASVGRIVRSITVRSKQDVSIGLPYSVTPGSIAEEEFKARFQPENSAQEITRTDYHHRRFYETQPFGEQSSETAIWLVPPAGGLKEDSDKLRAAARAEQFGVSDPNIKPIGELAAQWYGFEFSRFTPAELEKFMAKSESERDLEMLARGVTELSRRVRPLLKQLDSTYLALDQYMKIYNEALANGRAEVPEVVIFNKRGKRIVVVEASQVTPDEAAGKMTPHRKIFDQTLQAITEVVYRYVPGDVKLPKMEIRSVDDAEAALTKAQEWLDQAVKAYTVEFTAATVTDRVSAYQTVLGLRSSESTAALTDLEAMIQKLQIDLATGVEPGKRRALLDDLTDWLADRTQAEAEAIRVVDEVADLYQQVYQADTGFLKTRLALDGSSVLADLKKVVADPRLGHLFESELISQEAAQELLKKLDLGTLDVSVKRAKDFLDKMVAVVPEAKRKTVPKDLEKSFGPMFDLIETLASEKAEETPTAAEIADVAFQLNNLFDQQLTAILDQARANIQT